MADKGGARRPAGQDLEASSPDRIRNVVLVGPGGSGKTTLVETLLAAAGAIPRAGSVRDGTTVTDFEESEQAHERSNSLALAPLVHEGIKVNLIDTPGYADFVGELRAGSAPPTAPCSSSPPTRASTTAPDPSGASAPTSGCRAR